MVVLQFLLYPLSLIYQFLFFLNKRSIKSFSLETDLVLSVGNLSVGGTGKTPFTIYLIQSLKSVFPNHNFTVLSRGYGGSWSRTNGEVQVDSIASQAGDEPALIKQNIPYAQVLVGSNRLASYKKYVNQESRPIVVLDDGFQHFRIQRNIDIVLIDSTRLLGSGLTLPAGYLRETLSALNRAHAVVFTRYREGEENHINWEKLVRIRSSIMDNFPDLEIFHASEDRGLPLFWKDGKWKERDWNDLSNKSIFAFCGLGNPKPFFRSLEKEVRTKIHKKSYPDHYSFKKRDIRFLSSKAAEFILCTEKDIVKISNEDKNRFEGRLGYIPINTKVWEETKWINFLKNVGEKFLGKH
ncbi:MAG: tetraacyldisaccharide 4'-kinase [Leptospira sp.]|nr:tetraacyldisaccharide 4'-kinase [Leptospira sp.]